MMNINKPSLDYVSVAEDQNMDYADLEKLQNNGSVCYTNTTYLSNVLGGEDVYRSRGRLSDTVRLPYLSRSKLLPNLSLSSSAKVLQQCLHKSG